MKSVLVILGLLSLILGFIAVLMGNILCSGLFLIIFSIIYIFLEQEKLEERIKKLEINNINN